MCTISQLKDGPHTITYRKYGKNKLNSIGCHISFFPHTSDKKYTMRDGQSRLSENFQALACYIY